MVLRSLAAAILLLGIICALQSCVPGDRLARTDGTETVRQEWGEDPADFDQRIAGLKKGMAIDQVIRLFGEPRMETRLGEGQRILSFAKIYAGGRIRTIALAFQDGELSELPEGR